MQQQHIIYCIFKLIRINHKWKNVEKVLFLVYICDWIDNCDASQLSITIIIVQSGIMNFKYHKISGNCHPMQLLNAVSTKRVY